MIPVIFEQFSMRNLLPACLENCLSGFELLLDVKVLKAVSLPFHLFNFAGFFTGKTHFAIVFILKKTIRFDRVELAVESIKRIISS